MRSPTMDQTYPRPFRYHSTVCKSDLPKTILSLRKGGTIIRQGQDGKDYTPVEENRWIGVFDPTSGYDFIWDKKTNAVWWSVDEDGCALGPPTSPHAWMEDGTPIGRESALV